MTGGGERPAGSIVLTPAGSSDLDALVSLQRAAYAPNRAQLGVEPLPLLADYSTVLREMEVWLARATGKLVGALILQPRTADLLLWSIAVDPHTQNAGVGRTLLRAAESRAGELGFSCVRLYTGTPLKHLIGWYGRHGYAVERVETLSDRSITHMIKRLHPASAELAP